jgi:cleavage and polyadenylation specificity factor subunit 2
MARIATMEDVEGIRDEQEVDVEVDESNEPAATEGVESSEQHSPRLKNEPKKFVATVQEVHEAFDAVNTLRYSQPTHLQGNVQPCNNHGRNIDVADFQESVRV